MSMQPSENMALAREARDDYANANADKVRARLDVERAIMALDSDALGEAFNRLREATRRADAAHARYWSLVGEAPDE